MAKKARVYDGTAWQELASAQTDLTAYSTTAQMDTAITAGSGLKFITGASFTTVTNFSLPNDTFTSTYDNYKIIIQITAVTADADFIARLRASGADDTNAKYNTGMLGLAYNGTTSNSTGEGQTSFIFAEQDSGTVRYAMVMDIIAPKKATLTYLQGFYTYVNKAGSAVLSRTGSMHFQDPTVFDSFTFISSVASSITGSYKVYGYANS